MFQLLVLTNPVAGREEEYNEWYTNRHIPDVVAVPGVLAGQRFLTAGDCKWKYGAIYEIEGEVETALAAIQARAGSPQMPISEALDVENATSIALVPITDRYAG